MKNHNDAPEQPTPASSKYPERENLFQFLLKQKAKYPVAPNGLTTENAATFLFDPERDEPEKEDDEITIMFGR